MKESGGEGGIRTPGRGFSPYNGLANRRIQPLCHLSACGSALMNKPNGRSIALNGLGLRLAVIAGNIRFLTDIRPLFASNNEAGRMRTLTSAFSAKGSFHYTVWAIKCLLPGKARFKAGIVRMEVVKTQ